MGEKENRLSEFLDMERLQKLQDSLARALDMAFITVDYRGRPVTKASGFTGFCSCMGNHGSYSELCSRCYAHAGLHATMSGTPYICRCHAGLVEFAVPLMVDGKYMGSIMGGQCDLTGQHPVLEPVLPQQTNWEEVPELSGNRGGVYKTTYEKLEAGIQLAQSILEILLEENKNCAVQKNLQQKNRELLEEKAARVNLELALKLEEDSGSFVERLDQEHLFYMLNVISRLAFLEKAEETERTACDFAAMMRYVLENGEYNFVTLGDELEYIDYYLQIQRRRTEGRLYYEIRVPEKYYSTLCPFMLLHPLVKITVKSVLDHSLEGGKLMIGAQEEGKQLVVSVNWDCEALTDLKNTLLDLEQKRQGSPLDRLDRSLKSVFGQSCGVAFASHEDGRTGREIRIRLPLNVGTAERSGIL